MQNTQRTKTMMKILESKTEINSVEHTKEKTQEAYEAYEREMQKEYEREMQKEYDGYKSELRKEYDREMRGY